MRSPVPRAITSVGTDAPRLPTPIANSTHADSVRCRSAADAWPWCTDRRPSRIPIGMPWALNDINTGASNARSNPITKPPDVQAE